MRTRSGLILGFGLIGGDSFRAGAAALRRVHREHLHDERPRALPTSPPMGRASSSSSGTAPARTAVSTGSSASASAKGGQFANPEFPINTYTSNSQFAPRVAMNHNGDFVVVWTSAGQDGSASGIFGQRFAPSGAKAGAEFPVNTYTTGLQGEPTVAMDDAGDFVVVWSSAGQDGSGYGVFAQRFAGDGAKSGSEIAVNTYTTFDQHEPAVAMDEAGNFVVVWSSSGQDGDAEGVFGQRFDAAGAKRGAEFPVNTHTASDETLPAIASDRHGNFVVAWADHNIDGSSYGVVLRQFHADGENFGVEQIVDAFTENRRPRPPSRWARRRLRRHVGVVRAGRLGLGNVRERYDRLARRFGDDFRLKRHGRQSGRRASSPTTGRGSSPCGTVRIRTAPARRSSWRRQDLRPARSPSTCAGWARRLKRRLRADEAIWVEPSGETRARRRFSP